MTLASSLGLGAKTTKPATPSDVPTDIAKLDSAVQRKWAKIALSARSRARLYERLARPINSGMSYEDAIHNLYKRVAFRQPDDHIAIVLRTVIYRLQSGDKITDGLAPFIPLNELMLIQAGENNGHIAKGLFDAAKTIRLNSEIVTVSVRATVFPVLILLSVIGCLYIMGVYLIPEFERGMPKEEWQGAGLMLRYLGDFTAASGFFYLSAFFAMMLAIVILSLKRWSGGARVFFDRLPPYSLYKTFTGSAWLLVLSSMTGSGQPVWQSLATIHDVALSQRNRYVASRTLAVMRSNTEGHNSVAHAMEDSGQEFPDHELIADLVLMAGNDNFDQQMSEITNVWVTDRVETIKSQCFFLEILLMVLSACLLGAFMFAFYAVEQQFSQSIGL